MTTDSLLETIMTKGIQAHYPPDVLADAERLYTRVWRVRFHKSARSWASVSPGMRIAFCEMVLEARRMNQGGQS